MGHNTIAQKSFLSIGRRSADFANKLSSSFFKSPVSSFAGRNPEALWPNGVFIKPVDVNDLGISSQDSSQFHSTPDFSNGLEVGYVCLINNSKSVPLFKLGDSIIFPHQPEAQGIVLTPCSFSISVMFDVKGSLHEPRSPLDLHLTHLFSFPERSFE
ncbi:hypothetical protein G9C98_006364 [Cotesia typhae]|uniref:Uncharacterized protein n=1 Tax=Cotesia typhae TaxID=2053667 RepID=A0A8J5R536_9HYME|nr:hypothetical protein G9C98_006364 [Cotesia typhae]